MHIVQRMLILMIQSTESPLFTLEVLTLVRYMAITESLVRKTTNVEPRFQDFVGGARRKLSGRRARERASLIRL